MVPTYFRRCSGIECFNGHCGFALLLFAGTFVAASSIAKFNCPVQLPLPSSCLG
jgi:hypothetical protein